MAVETLASFQALKMVLCLCGLWFLSSSSSFCFVSDDMRSLPLRDVRKVGYRVSIPHAKLWVHFPISISADLFAAHIFRILYQILCIVSALKGGKSRDQLVLNDDQFWTRCWRAFDNSAQFLLIYLFDFRFRRMLNRNVLELLNENFSIVNNVIDTRSEHSVAQVPFRSNSLFGPSSFLHKR